MKTYIRSGRDTILINYLSLPATDTREEAYSLAPFLVRAKWIYEPEIRAYSWDEPDSAEYFAFETLYVYSGASFATEHGEVVVIKPCEDLLQILGEKQLALIEEVLRESWEDEADSYEPMNDYECGI